MAPRTPTSASSTPRAALSRHREERILLAAVLTLLSLGMVMVYSATSADAILDGTSSTAIITKQIVFAGIGFLSFAVVMRMRPTAFTRIAPLAMGAAIVMLAAVMILPPPIVPTINGAERWLIVGGFQLQPSEVAKLALILWIAGFLARDPGRLRRPGGLRPILIMTALLAALIVKEPDLGTASLIVAIALAMVFVAGVPVRKIGLVVGSFALLALIMIAVSPYQQKRVHSFLDPWSAPTGDAYQNVQAQIAIGSGGVFGRGLGNSIQKMKYLPEAHTDMIGAIIGEELGLIGMAILIVCFVAIGAMGFRIAMRARSPSSRLIAVGITTMICLQAAVNLAQVMGLFPITGVPLPLVSAGGTNLIICLTAIGLLMNISRQGDHAARPARRSTGSGGDRGGRDGRAREAGARGRGRIAS